MKNIHLKKIKVILGVGLIICLSGILLSNSVSAYYADTTSAVYQGMGTTGHRYAAVNVVDDDGTVYTVYYRYYPSTDNIAYRFEGDLEWKYWPQGLRVVYSHMETLANAGVQAAVSAGR